MKHTFLKDTHQSHGPGDPGSPVTSDDDDWGVESPKRNARYLGSMARIFTPKIGEDFSPF